MIQGGRNEWKMVYRVLLKHSTLSTHISFLVIWKSDCEGKCSSFHTPGTYQ